MLEHLLKKWVRPSLVETVPKSQYDTLAAEYDALVQECESLEGQRDRAVQQGEDLSVKYSALGFDYALVEGLAKKAIALLQEVDTTRTGGMALYRKRIDLLREAQSAGLIEEENKEV